VRALTELATAAGQARDQNRVRRLAADAEAAARTTTDPGGQVLALIAVAKAATQAGDLDRARHLFARVPIMDPLKISWVKAACHFYPRALEGAWDILASAYAIRI
jgi:hypothetical protein